jgi:hypothetical protein
MDSDKNVLLKECGYIKKGKLFSFSFFIIIWNYQLFGKTFEISETFSIGSEALE